MKKEDSNERKALADIFANFLKDITISQQDYLKYLQRSRLPVGLGYDDLLDLIAKIAKYNYDKLQFILEFYHLIEKDRYNYRRKKREKKKEED